MTRCMTAVGMITALLTGAICHADSVDLHTRTKVETSPGSGRFHTVVNTETWDPAKSAIVICDMWNQHWCQGATRRVADMAPRMNEVLRVARDRGFLIIHAPSDTMRFYADTDARQLAASAPKAKPRPPITGRTPFPFSAEPRLPIDDSDGGCNCEPMCRQGSPWTRQINLLEIMPGDAVTDSGKAYDLMRSKGIDNVIIMGVHTNMCVLGRPFAIRKMVQAGQRVLLMRDLTDTMYNSRSAPYVNHFTGNDLVTEHIEKYWCPTITSADFVDEDPFRFPEDDRPRVAIIMAEDEYQTEQSLPTFAREELGRDFQVNLVFGSDDERNSIPGMEILKDADLAIVSVRRRFPTPDQLSNLRSFVASGKGVVGIRTASHAFALRESQKPPSGHEAWQEFDQQVFGGNYHGHYGRDEKNPTRIARVPSAADHPIVRDLARESWPASSWLYKNQPIQSEAVLLLTGTMGDKGVVEPVAWTMNRADGGRSFYTSLGHMDDFKIPEFRQLLRNGIYWAAQLEIPDSSDLP